eukprot:SM008755S23881  [mRNA]  locus=s8755:53:469:+ [translate_table: standard]
MPWTTCARRCVGLRSQPPPRWPSRSRSSAAARVQCSSHGASLSARPSSTPASPTSPSGSRPSRPPTTPRRSCCPRTSTPSPRR